MNEHYLALTLGLVALMLEHIRSRSAVTRDELAALSERVAKLEGRG